MHIRGLNHWFGEGEQRCHVLQGIDLDLRAREIVILSGPSGCGKTTLLTLMGALRAVQDGDVQVLGEQLRGASQVVLRRVRRRIGVIFQGHNLLRCLTAEQNVQMGADLNRQLPYRERRLRSHQLLREVGLADQLGKLPAALSGGQRQRVAIARALAAEPHLLLADEPTAALDSHTGREVVELLQRMVRDHGCSVLMVTHDPRILDVADRLLVMEDGRIRAMAAAA
ncbi:MAG: ATP-binding cassette domain-containing protein [Aphanocapsa feldmannii 277cV]|uniref:ATP-binding cassette domain-containing protein n=2 Tax=Aphanocapsa feldmannii TaxID=192050 RepID=A0A524RLS1_9CHRO|nr:MAG: ATP-binding cassette domain-containing protein [Aphanocapsa feldmannii 288cV]TGG91017.1 MAG: ATP-binding cassette domain-containing protein [Aphanocapsa feldmannii 277cV]TGH22956.1 MAG: ATP-binding cassette domain-containing protein [Aphanocapsa feldmannii 277cI]